MGLIFVAVALSVGALVYFVVSGLKGYEERLSQEVARKEALLTKVTLISESLAQYNGRPAARGRRKPLIGYIEQLAARNGLKDRIQLNLVPTDKARGVEAINIKLDNLSLDDMVSFIHAIENSKPVLVVDQMEITNSFRSQDQLRLSIRVLAQK
jgi:hypothetical protein